MQIVIGLVLGMIAGAAGALLWMRRRMRGEMIEWRESPLDFDQTLARLAQAVPEIKGWGFPIESLDFTAKLAEKGFAPRGIRRARILFICNPAYAEAVVSQSPRMTAMMPCSWGVLEMEDGTTRLAKMNVGMMSGVFGGVVGQMLGRVSADEKRILAALD